MSDHAGAEIELWPIDTIEGAAYNPRKTSDERLQEVYNSLSYLGFILPLHATPERRLLSGHQRTRVAREMGYTQVPIVVNHVEEKMQKGINVFFNRATNDLDLSKTNAKTAFQEFLDQKQATITEAVTKVEPDTFPCLNRRRAETSEFADTAPTVAPSAISNVYQLVRRGINIPVVVCGSEIINGLARYWTYRQQGYRTFDVVEVSPEQKDYVYLVLNLLSMDFDFQKEFADELRTHAYRRHGPEAAVRGMSRTYSYFVYGKATAVGTSAFTHEKNEAERAKFLPHKSPKARSAFRAVYGHTMVDFGAGTYKDAKVMQAAGFDMMPFEPYCFPPGEHKQPNPDYSRERASIFLDWLVDHRERGVDSVITSYMLNSIPHHKDRMACLTIMAALCRLKTNVFVGTQHVMTRRRGAASNMMSMGMEPNMTLTGDVGAYKSQKFFYEDELEAMLKVFWREVSHPREQGSTLYSRCSMPKRLTPRLLSDALEIEFDLPYKDGSRMNRVDEAKKAFSTYTGMKLP